MRFLFAALVLAGAPAVGLAQAQSSPKPAAKPQASKAATPAKPRQPLARSAQKAVEEATPLEDDFDPRLSEELLAVARQVYVGTMKCELGNSVTVTPMKRPGVFQVSTKGQRFRMHPVESRTGAIRLEDSKRGAMWLQLGNKSMLMSQREGRRLADECQSPEQVTQAEYLKKNPMPSLLEPLPPQAPGPQQPAQDAQPPAAAAAGTAAGAAPAAAPADAATQP